jgi:hypothetical protein
LPKEDTMSAKINLDNKMLTEKKEDFYQSCIIINNQQQNITI